MIVDEKIHRFAHDVGGIELPPRFTYPMRYVPHELCRVAAAEVMDYALGQEAWHDELMAGKMLGVLVVRVGDRDLGYLAAFSGNLAHSTTHPYFVPPVYDLQDPLGIFRAGEAEINDVSARIKQLEASDGYRDAMDQVFRAMEDGDRAIAVARAHFLEKRNERHALRDSGSLSAEEAEALTRESQFQKAELRRMRKKQKEHIANLQKRVEGYEANIARLKKQRKLMSEQLQRQLFELYVVKNAKGESRNVSDIFYKRLHSLPPGGTGECCAPKLLQYAFLHDLRPVCMAEFWVGRSPLGEVRHHGHFYQACRSKCLPLLEFMLQGLELDNAWSCGDGASDRVRVVHDDEWLMIVEKPSGMLTVPGADDDATSLQDIVRKMLPRATGPLIVHRLDQDTSGLVMIAKSKRVHKQLQQLFEKHRIHKQYMALLDGTPARARGTIVLPLIPDVDDRPRQRVDMEHGKTAITKFEVVEYRNDKTLVSFTPLTGRTHQLRVHASHPLGLNCPITGDMLYGTASSRLFLHACSLSFDHPGTGVPFAVSSRCPF